MTQRILSSLLFVANACPCGPSCPCGPGCGCPENGKRAR